MAIETPEQKAQREAAEKAALAAVKAAGTATAEAAAKAKEADVAAAGAATAALEASVAAAKQVPATQAMVEAQAKLEHQFWQDVANGLIQHPGKCPLCGRDRAGSPELLGYPVAGFKSPVTDAQRAAAAKVRQEVAAAAV